jgi:hypothetical protein
MDELLSAFDLRPSAFGRQSSAESREPVTQAAFSIAVRAG